MMKKLFALLLAFAMVFSLAACGSTPAQEPTEEPTPVTTPKPTPVPTPEPAPEPTPEPEPTPSPKPEPDGQFDYSVLENLKGYDYDKFDKSWSYYAAYDRVFSDADVIIGIKLFGEDGGNNLEEVDLYTKVVDKQGNKLETVETMAFLIDDTLYSYENMPLEEGTMAGSVILYNSGYELIKALAEANTVSVKLNFYSNQSMTIDLEPAQFESTLKALCQNVVKYNIWDYYIPNPMLASIESLWGLTIS